MNMYESYGHAVYHVRIKAFLVKMTFWPQWPQMTQDWRLTHNIGRGTQADQPVWVLWSCYVTWTSYSIFSENDLLTPVTPNDPWLTFDPVT